MSFFFIANNLHFTIEILGALAFLIAAWLSLDAWRVSKNRIVSARMFGFAFLAIWQVIHAFDLGSDLIHYLGFLLHLVGLLLLVLSFIWEKPVPRPEFRAVLVLPMAAALSAPVDFLGFIGYSVIAFLAYRQYRLETKKTLAIFWRAFLFLALGTLLAVFHRDNSLPPVWFIGHILELLGFGSLIWWVWQYLTARFRESLVIIFTGFALLMSAVVTLAFSTILIGRVEAETKENLLVDAKVMDLAIGRLKEEALAKAQLLSERGLIAPILAANDFADLEELIVNDLQQEKLGFLTVLNKNGDVVLRAHAPSQKDDNLAGERAVMEALHDHPFVEIETSPAEGFSIRAAAPLVYRGRQVGAIVLGFPLDNAMVDGIKKLTGLDTSIFEKDARVATTEFGPDGKSRSIGIKVSDSEVLGKTLGQGKPVTKATQILSQPFLASYLPITNADGKVIGMISASKPQKEIADLAIATNRLTLITVIVIMLILIAPIYSITKGLMKTL